MRQIDGDALKIMLDTFATIVGFGGVYDRGQVMECIDAAPTVAEDTNVLGKWISVKDRLPETGRLALVYGSAGAMTIARYIATNEWLVPGIFSTVTHWMPLPEPPKEENG